MNLISMIYYKMDLVFRIKNKLIKLNNNKNLLFKANKYLRHKNNKIKNFISLIMIME